jgi:hypothetical protein
VDSQLKLGVNKKHYLSHGDLTGRCPQCFNNNVQKVGVLTINGTPQDVIKCDNCNTLSSGADGGVRSLIDEAMEILNKGKGDGEWVPGREPKVGFTSTAANDTSTNSNVTINSGAPIEAKMDWTTQNNLNEMKSKIENMSYAIEDLVRVVTNMAQQNVDLMNKLATDPLVGIRKAVNSFNLE